MEQPVDVSIVIATRNRAGALTDTLQAVARLKSEASWEVVFVDNGSSDDTLAVLEDFQARSSIRSRIVSEPRPGAGRARNTGWRAARGEIIGFFDDDCYPAENYIDELKSCFSDPAVGFIGGRVLLYDPTDLRITTQEATEPIELKPRTFVYAGVLQGANWAVRRSALEQVGGFDPNLGPGTPFVCEEVELQARLSYADWVGGFDPRPLVYHHHRRKSLSDLDALQRTYDLGRGAYYAKCLLDPRLRAQYARQWIRMIPGAPISRVYRELRSAFTYYRWRASGKLEPSP